MTTPRCLVCATELSRIGYFDGWCIGCAGASLAAELRLRDGSPEVVALRVAWLRDQGADPIARAVIGPLPFDAQPSAATLERLTDE